MRLRDSLRIVGLLSTISCSFPEYVAADREPDTIASTCTDGKPSAAETGTDCGGSCPRCPSGQACKSGADCNTGACVANLCQPAACDDGLANGVETDVDCGGTCSACQAFRLCLAATDCVDQSCVDGSCAPPACDDGARNGGESDIDCGGPCTPCAEGRACKAAADCRSELCDTNVCVPELCTDGEQNASETDVDCGGGVCAPCSMGRRCLLATDCASLICDPTQLRCTESACDDGIRNGAESDVDCGGSACSGCGTLKRCATAGDCESGVCNTGRCVPSEASGVQLPRDGWGITPSSSYPSSPWTNMLDGDDKTWWSSGASQSSDMWVELDMQEPQAFFEILLETYEEPNDHPIKLDVFISEDGTYGAPLKEGVYGNVASRVELESAAIARYVRIEIAEPNPEYWWAIGEFRIYR